MEKLERIRQILCREIEEIANKGDMSAGDLQSVHMITDTIKNIDKIEMLENGEYSGYSGYSRGNGMNSYSYDGYSRTGGRYPRNSYGDSYGDSYGRHYVRAHYSRDDGNDMMMRCIDEMMNDGRLSPTDREALQRAKNILMG